MSSQVKAASVNMDSRIENQANHKKEKAGGPNSIIKINYDKSNIKPTKKRYLILLLFCLNSMINSAQWIYLSSVTSTISRFYQVDNIAVNWTSMIYMLVYIPLVVPSSWLFERVGMRNSILLGSLGTSLGAILKCFACQPDRFYLLMFGQTLAAISQLFVLSVPPRLASVWFPDEQVALANALGVFGNQLGIALGFVVPQLALGQSDDVASSDYKLANIESSLGRLFLGIALTSCIVSLLIAIYFDEYPKCPPGRARLEQIKQENATTESGIAPLVSNDSLGSSSGAFMALLLDLASDKNFVLLVIGYGLNVGVFYAISTVLNQMIAPTWQNATALTGRLGLVMVVSGMLGSIIAGYILDRSHMYRLVNMSLYALSLLSMLLFTATLELHNVIALYATSALLGYFMTGYLLIGYEMSSEITWPLPETISAGLLNLSAQVSKEGISSNFTPVQPY